MRDVDRHEGNGQEAQNDCTERNAFLLEVWMLVRYCIGLKAHVGLSGWMRSGMLSRDRKNDTQ